MLSGHNNVDEVFVRRVVANMLTVLAAESARRAGVRLQDWLEEAKSAYGVSSKKGKRR